MENLIISHLKRLMPREETPVFNGDTCEYPSFIKAFHRVVSDRITRDDEKLTYLELYTSGLAKKMVSACQYLPTEEGYKTALSSLEERFGKEDTIVRESLTKVTNWPRIKNGDAQDLEVFLLQLHDCRNMLLSGMRGFLELEWEETLRRVLARLPSTLQEKWRDKAAQIKYQDSRQAAFEDVVDFVREETQKIADPVLGTESTERTGRALEGKSHKPDQTRPKVKINTDAGQEAPRTPARCIFWEKGHNADECEWLRAKPEKERADYARENSLCLACLRGGHLARSCKRRKFCKICKARHPTALHRGTSSGEEVAQANEDNASKQSESNNQAGHDNK